MTSGLNPEAKRQLDQYLQERQRELLSAVKDSDDLMAQRWWKLIMANASVIVVGAVSVLAVAHSSAETAAVNAVTSTNGIIAGLVAQHVTSVGESVREVSEQEGRLEQLLKQFNLKSEGAAKDWDEALNRIVTLRSRVESEIEHGTVELDRLADRIGDLRSKIASLEGDGTTELQEIEEKLDRWSTIERYLSGENANLLLDLRQAVSPVGSIIAWADVVAPPGWMVCDGQRLRGEDYPALAKVLGVDAEGEIRLPNYVGQFLVGAAESSYVNRLVPAEGPRLNVSQKNTSDYYCQDRNVGLRANPHSNFVFDCHLDEREVRPSALSVHWIIKVRPETRGA